MVPRETPVEMHVIVPRTMVGTPIIPVLSFPQCKNHQDSAMMEVTGGLPAPDNTMLRQASPVVLEL